MDTVPHASIASPTTFSSTCEIWPGRALMPRPPATSGAIRVTPRRAARERAGERWTGTLQQLDHSAAVDDVDEKVKASVERDPAQER